MESEQPRIFTSKMPPAGIPVVRVDQYVLETAERWGDRVALVDSASGRSYTWLQLRGAVRKVATGLYQHGLRKGDVLFIFSPNLPEYAIAFHAVASIGGILTTCSPLANVDEVARQLQDSEAKFFLTIPPFVPKAKEAIEKSGVNVQETFVFGEAEGVTPFAALLTAEGEFPEVEVDPKEDPVVLPYSSGTTGLPKGVVLTHYNLVANMCQVAAVENDYSPEKDVFIGVLPFYHIYAMIVVLNLALRLGVKTVVMAKFDLPDYLRLVQEHKVTYAHIVPPIVLALAKHPLVDQYDVSSLRMIFSGAAPLSAEVENQVKARLSVRVKQGYGMTELSPATHIGDDRTPTGSVGLLLPNLEAKIVDPESGKTLGVGEDGELWVRGPNVMKGYWKRPDATAQTVDADGFLHTGDIAHVDEDGYYFIVDRLKELVKYKGFQVPPAELEAVLLAHPAIADAAVIGKPDLEAGELPKAFVVVKPGQTLQEEDVIKHVDERVTPYKKLRGGVEFVEQIPKSPAGKILRRVLKAQEVAKGQ